jgi:hypothetical protein
MYNIVKKGSSSRIKTNIVVVIAIYIIYTIFIQWLLKHYFYVLIPCCCSLAVTFLYRESPEALWHHWGSSIWPATRHSCVDRDCHGYITWLPQQWSIPLWSTMKPWTHHCDTTWNQLIWNTTMIQIDPTSLWSPQKLSKDYVCADQIR